MSPNLPGSTEDSGDSILKHDRDKISGKKNVNEKTKSCVEDLRLKAEMCKSTTFHYCYSSAQFKTLSASNFR